ncbi:MAG: peptide-methionine (R)-S-oxide reductase, partial [Pseudomonadota bacterium]
SRRTLLGSLPVALSGAALATHGHAAEGGSDEFTFEINRTDEEWRARLTDDEYAILREGGTEVPYTDPLWESTDAGMYSCKGCGLPVYDARWKVVVDKGWLFYRHAEPRSVLMGIDKSVYGEFAQGTDMGPVVPDAVPAGLSEEEVRAIDPLLLIEVHCRRCGSHLGHLLIVERKLLHCINGTALNFTPQAA